jgi:integrase
MKSSNLKLIECTNMRPVGRKPNAAYRVREHLTEGEITRLLAALKANRHGHRDWLIGLLIYRHGLRVSEACDLRWDDIDLASAPFRSAGSRAASIAPTTLSAMSLLD